MRSPMPLSRRGLLSAGGALGAGALLTACGGGSSSNDGSGDDSSGGGSWEFVDDRGEKATAASVPTSIVAFIGSAAALHDFGVSCVGVFGPSVQQNGEPDTQAGDLDVDKVKILGNAWGEFNMDEYLLLEPDLLVSSMYDNGVLWYVPEESAEQILSVVPSAGISITGASLLTPIQRYAELAESLGADLSSPLVTEAKTRFEAASEAVRQAVKSNPGIKVLACSAETDMFYASTPAAYPDLLYLEELGVELVVPENIDGGYFEHLSWENVDTYPADLLLLDSRSVALQPSDLTDKPTWARLPVVRAEQFVPWNSEPRYSYAGAAPLLEAVAESVRDAKKVA